MKFEGFQPDVRAGIQDVWQRNPVSLETCWVPGYWLKHGWDDNYILGQALRWHVTSVNVRRIGERSSRISSGGWATASSCVAWSIPSRCELAR